MGCVSVGRGRRGTGEVLGGSGVIERQEEGVGVEGVQDGGFVGLRGRRLATGLEVR